MVKVDFNNKKLVVLNLCYFSIFLCGRNFDQVDWLYDTNETEHLLIRIDTIHFVFSLHVPTNNVTGAINSTVYVYPSGKLVSCKFLSFFLTPDRCPFVFCLCVVLFNLVSVPVDMLFFPVSRAHCFLLVF